MPYLGSTVFFATICVALLVALTGWFLTVRAVAPAFVDRARDSFGRRPVITVLVGGVLGGVATVVGLVLLSQASGIAKLAGMVIIGSALTVGISGATGLAARVGEGLASPQDEGREWMRVLKGGLTLELACLLPFIGWFLLAPIVVLGGVGAAVQSALASLFASKSRSEDSAHHAAT